MKISKLFHWLYAILMLCPVFAVGITCLTHVFNETVEAETQTVDIEYKYETNNPQDSIVLGNIYNISFSGTLSDLRGEMDENDFSFTLISGDITYTNCYWKSDESVPNEDFIVSPSYTNITIEQEYIFMFLNANGTYMSYYLDKIVSMNLTNITIEGQIVITNWSITDNTTFFPNSLSIASNIPIENVEITTVAQDDSTNIFYTSCEQVKDSFVLNWCNYYNPVRAVYDYGSALFNVDSDNLVNYFLTYWTSISIIWLVFDVFMYVPLLVHRWIDKAKIE